MGRLAASFINGVMTGLFLLFSLFFIMMITNKPGEMPSILVLAASIILSVLVPAVTGALLSITSSNRAYRDMGY
jgi:ABC-type transport system involved in multi-copper enzyme maturation permease subunit